MLGQSVLCAAGHTFPSVFVSSPCPSQENLEGGANWVSDIALSLEHQS